MPATPAAKYKLAAKDRLLAVNGVDVSMKHVWIASDEVRLQPNPIAESFELHSSSLLPIQP